jgi:hypothetical protein
VLIDGAFDGPEVFELPRHDRYTPEQVRAVKVGSVVLVTHESNDTSTPFEKPTHKPAAYNPGGTSHQDPTVGPSIGLLVQ